MPYDKDGNWIQRSVYDPESPTAKAQQGGISAWKGVPRLVTNLADKFAGGKGARQIVAAGTEVAGDIAESVGDARRHHQTAVDVAVGRTPRVANAEQAKTADEFQSGAKQQRQPAAKSQGPIDFSQQTKTADRFQFSRGGTTPTPPPTPTRSPAPGSGTQAVNMQDPNYINPVGQSAPMDGGVTGAAGVTAQPQRPRKIPGANGRPARRPGIVIMDNKPTETPADKLAKEMNFSSIGDMIVSGNKLKAAQGLSEIDARQSKTEADQATLELDRVKAAQTAADKREENRIYGSNVESQNREREASIAAKEAEMKSGQALTKLREQYMGEKDPQKRMKLAADIMALSGKAQDNDNRLTENQRYTQINDVYEMYNDEAKTAKELDPKAEFMPFEQWIETKPELQRLFGGKMAQAPDSALKHLEQNPQLAEQFKAKYGYLPEGY